MANQEHVDMLLQDGVEAWNQWRTENPGSQPDLANVRLFRVNLSGADLRGANLDGADLRKANCVGAYLANAKLRNCMVYGIAVQDVNLEGAVQADLRITDDLWDKFYASADNLEVAQFLYLLLRNEKMRAVLDTITSKVVLILGRFSDEHKPILDALREALRRHPMGYVPVVLDFEPQDIAPTFEVVKKLANLARFVIADLADPNIVRSALMYITANLPTVPVQPLIEESISLPSECATWANNQSFLDVYRYADLPQLLANLTESVITPVEAYVQARKL